MDRVPEGCQGARTDGMSICANQRLCRTHPDVSGTTRTTTQSGTAKSKSWLEGERTVRSVASSRVCSSRCILCESNDRSIDRQYVLTLASPSFRLFVCLTPTCPSNCLSNECIGDGQCWNDRSGSSGLSPAHAPTEQPRRHCVLRANSGLYPRYLPPTCR